MEFRLYKSEGDLKTLVFWDVTPRHDVSMQRGLEAVLSDL